MSAPAPIRRLLTTQEVASLLNLTPAALHMQRMRGEGLGTIGFRIGARVLFDPADVESYIAERKADRGGDGG